MEVIAFDVFGTVFDLSGVPRSEIQEYARHIRRDLWMPLKLPKSWETLPSHADSASGIQRLRKKFFVVTCSNGPLGLLAKLSKHNGIEWDAIIPLELNHVFKPRPEAYMTICEVLDVQPSQVRMVTANRDFGDIEASAALGMKSAWIRGESDVKDIIALAEHLGC